MKMVILIIFSICIGFVIGFYVHKHMFQSQKNVVKDYNIEEIIKECQPDPIKMTNSYLKLKK
jgi:uncharacterized protein YneF (UPF0154 family)